MRYAIVVALCLFVFGVNGGAVKKVKKGFKSKGSGKPTRPDLSFDEYAEESKEQPSIDVGETAVTEFEEWKEQPSFDVVESFVEELKLKTVAKNVDWESEFARIPIYKDSVREPASQLPQNGIKNRYSNVPCFEKTRVHLSMDETGREGVDDYIHANYIQFPDT